MKRSRFFGTVAFFLLLLCFVGQVFAGAPKPAAKEKDDFPSNAELAKINVAIMMESFFFPGGMRKTKEGKLSCNGLDIAASGGGGSGFLVKEDGTIVTNYHVAGRMMKGSAKFQDGSTYEIKNIKVYDPDNDIAILKVSGDKKWPTVKLGDSDKVEPRDRVMAVGNPLGMGINITEGQISQAVKNDSGSVDLIRHTAQIAPGNSGGALYRGDAVVGVNVSVNLAGGGQFTGFNNAIPINKVKTLLNNPKFDRLIPLSQAFPTDIKEVIKHAVAVQAFTGQIDGAKKADDPGTAAYKAVFNGLSDMLILVESPGKDLRILLLNAQGQPIGCGDLPENGYEFLLFTNDYAREVIVAVLNYDGTPANFGLKIMEISW